MFNYFILKVIVDVIIDGISGTIVNVIFIAIMRVTIDANIEPYCDIIFYLAYATPLMQLMWQR